MKPHIISIEDFKGFDPAVILASSSDSKKGKRKRLSVKIDIFNDKLSYIIVSHEGVRAFPTFEKAMERYNEL